MEGLHCLDLPKVVRQTDRLYFDELPFPYLEIHQMDDLEQQHRKIFVDSNEEAVFKNEIKFLMTILFWTYASILQYLGKPYVSGSSKISLSCLLATQIRSVLVKPSVSCVTLTSVSTFIAS